MQKTSFRHWNISYSQFIIVAWRLTAVAKYIFANRIAIKESGTSA
jgi:hypothetical protein